MNSANPIVESPVSNGKRNANCVVNHPPRRHCFVVSRIGAMKPLQRSPLSRYVVTVRLAVGENDNLSPSESPDAIDLLTLT